MTRNLKVLGLALVAIMALSAMVASSALANGKFTAEGGGAESIVTEDVGAEDLFTVGSNELTCSEESFSGSLEEPASSIEVTPDYTGCKTVGAAFNNVTVTHNGCKFKFTTATTIATDEDGLSVAVVGCTKPLEIHHYSSAANHAKGVSSCTNTVANQTASGHVLATSLTEAKDILLEGTVTVVVQTHGACSFGLTLNLNSEYHTSTTVKGAAGTRIHVG